MQSGGPATAGCSTPVSAEDDLGWIHLGGGLGL
jgi:hypothetical protein